MKPADEVFNCEMERATLSQRTCNDGYWMGYATGLMRARFGAVAVADGHHEAWSADDAPGGTACGYRDGYAKLAVPVTSGRAKVIET